MQNKVLFNFSSRSYDAKCIVSKPLKIKKKWKLNTKITPSQVYFFVLQSSLKKKLVTRDCKEFLGAPNVLMVSSDHLETYLLAMVGLSFFTVSSFS